MSAQSCLTLRAGAARELVRRIARPASLAQVQPLPRVGQAYGTCHRPQFSFKGADLTRPSADYSRPARMQAHAQLCVPAHSFFGSSCRGPLLEQGVQPGAAK